MTDPLRLEDATRLPLDDVRILDLTQVGAGPLAMSMLGDFGADVIKVEPPSGEAMRTGVDAHAPGFSTAFTAVNRSKRAIALDLKSPEGARVLRRLLESADVLVLSMRPTVAKRLGLSYEALSADFPQLVHVSITGNGERGPRADDPGVDLTAQALGGIMDVTGEEDGPPLRCGAAVTDYALSHMAVSAICLALIARGRSGLGQSIELNLLDAALSLIPQHAGTFLATGVSPRRAGAGHPSVVPYQSFATQDGHVVIACLNDRFWAGVCQALDRQDLADDAALTTNAARVRERDRLVSTLAHTLAEGSTDDWVRRLRAAGVPTAPVQTVGAALADPQTHQNGMLLTLTHSEFGEYETVGNPLHLSRTPARPSRPVPGIGQDTVAVLRDVAGYDADDIRRMETEGVIAASARGQAVATESSQTSKETTA